jgi:Mrp family chromosome partitioning ATPase
MSRNFELIQQFEKDPQFRSAPADGQAYISSGETAAGAGESLWAGDEALRLVQQIFLLQVQTPPRMVVFAGIDHGNGCSRICASVAQVLARNASGPVCLVEANFRSPALPELFGTTNHHGLTDALLREGPIRSFAKPVGANRMWLISCGALAADSPNLLSTERVKARLAELRGDFEFIIIDAPPLTHYADAISLGQLTDGLVLILEANSTRREAAQTAVASLRSSKVPILGAVLNKRTFPIPEKIYKKL